MSAIQSASMLPPQRMTPTLRPFIVSLFLHERRERCRACAFGEVVGVGVVGADRVRHLVVRDGDDAVGACAVDVEGGLHGDADGHAVGEGAGGGRLDEAAGFDGELGAGGGVADDAHDLGLEAEGVAGGDDAADAGAAADGDVDGVEVGLGGEEFPAVGRDAADEFAVEGRDDEEAEFRAHAEGFLARFVEVVAVFDEFRAEGAHGGVLLGRVAARDVDERAEAGSAGGAGLALAVVAAGRGDDAGAVGLRAAEPVDQRDAAADLEGAGGGVVLVLDPDGRAGAFRQQRPGVLRGGGHVGVDEAGRVLEFAGGEHGPLLRLAAGPVLDPAAGGRNPARVLALGAERW